MTDVAFAQPRPAWYRPGLADVVFLLVALAVLGSARGNLLDDPGVGWHLRDVDAIWDHGWWLTEDPFTDPRTRGDATAPWYTNQWLGDVCLYVGWKWGGLEGIAVVCALILGWLGRSLYLCLVEDGLAWPIAVAWTFLGMMGSTISWLSRPNLFTLLFLFFTARACVRLHEGKLSLRHLPGLIIMFAFWANIHGGFIAGLITLVATCGIQLLLFLWAEGQALARALLAKSQTLEQPAPNSLDAQAAKVDSGEQNSSPSVKVMATLPTAHPPQGFDEDVPRDTEQVNDELDKPARQFLFRRFGLALGICLGAGLATLLNPYGINLYRWVFLLLGDPFFMNHHVEWLSPNFHDAGSFRYEFWLLLFPLILGLSSRRPSLVELALSVLWLHFALNGIRYWALWVLVLTPVLARCSVEIAGLGTLAGQLGLSAAPGTLFHGRAGQAGFLGTVLIALALLAWSHFAQGSFAYHNQDDIPSQSLDRFVQIAADWVERHPGQKPIIFHNYNWGGYLVWKGWPGIYNWMDDRNETQGEARIQRYYRIIRGEQGWQEDLGRADLICIIPDEALADRLARDDKIWTEIHRDKHVVVFERR